MTVQAQPSRTMRGQTALFITILLRRTISSWCKKYLKKSVRSVRPVHTWPMVNGPCWMRSRWPRMRLLQMKSVPWFLSTASILQWKDFWIQQWSVPSTRQGRIRPWMVLMCRCCVPCSWSAMSISSKVRWITWWLCRLRKLMKISWHCASGLKRACSVWKKRAWLRGMAMSSCSWPMKSGTLPAKLKPLT